ncbi:MAG: response regulator transcription factor [Lachnospiraceae bacterium]|nr:response regulator transcription factor [Lachnospiraceae bacterium]
MNICICDDEIHERKMIREISEECFKEMDMPYQISEAENGMEALEMIGETDLLILDIEMPGMDGVTLKNRLQDESINTKVIFVTSHDELMPEAFGINVIGFVGKEWLSIRLSRYLKLAVTLRGKDILIDKTYHSRDITKIHSEREYCNLYFKDGSTALIRSSLKSMELLLREADFVQISRAWLVNLKFVERYSRRVVSMQGEELVVNRGFRESFDKRYENFCERNARYY